MALQLEVRQHQHNCVFQLRWGDEQILAATLPDSRALVESYQDWQQAYLQFYRSFRGRVAKTGRFSEVEDWRAQLVKAEAELLTEFHNWLRSEKLAEIRTQIAQIARELSTHSSTKSEGHNHLTIALTCSPIELERLPWEAWEIGKELATTTNIRIARTPDRIRAEPIKETRQGRNRVLIILGDDTGLDFKSDREAVQGLSHVAEIHFVGWKPGQNITELLSQITTAITDERGWDILLFAGHSNETAITGGELAIAPGVSVSINEMASSLTIAKQRGLQFALFNSCSGLSMAKSLIDLGFNQVAIMREPIHNKVAQEFLVQFLRSMGEYKDVHESLLAASQFLKLEKNLTYPSTSLIPSLFCRPGQPLFRFRRFGWKECVRAWLPTRRQAMILSGLVALSVLLPVQGALLEQRLWTQALYRRFTGQLATTASPPVALVQIDEQSLQKAGIREPNPMDRTYLARLIDRLAQSNVKVIGIDYLLDRSAEQKVADQTIAKSIQSAVSQGTWFTFITKQDLNGEWATLLPETDLPNPPLSNWSLLADPNILGFDKYPQFLPTYMSLVYPGSPDPLPFAYLLALSHQLNTTSPSKLQPDLQSNADFLSQLFEYSNEQNQNLISLVSPQARFRVITILSYVFRQTWLHPVIDFSLPPDQVYQTIPAWKLLDGSLTDRQLEQLQQQVVIIAAGGYEESGLTPSEDNMALPVAVRHWRFWQENHSASLEFLTGGEVHAYMLYQFLTQRLVVPIPDLWMILLAALLGKGTVLALQKRSFQRRWMVLLAGSTATYGLISLQLYVSAAVLLPWLLPSIAFWIYIFPLLRKQLRY